MTKTSCFVFGLFFINAFVFFCFFVSQLSLMIIGGFVVTVRPCSEKRDLPAFT